MRKQVWILTQKIVQSELTGSECSDSQEEALCSRSDVVLFPFERKKAASVLKADVRLLRGVRFD
jgi:hypothetical protein